MSPYPDAKKKGTLASPATARANMVFPVPGGLAEIFQYMKAVASARNKSNPVNKTPFGSLPPRAVKEVGSFKNNTTSRNS